jgi:arginine decarboxylase
MSERSWSIQKSLETYGVKEWGADFFGINEFGELYVKPHPKSPPVELIRIIKGLTARGVKTPVLLRFNEIIKQRIFTIQDAFAAAIELYGYRGKYQLAYPVKVNQNAHVVETVRKSDNKNPVALEVGSKAELVAIMAIHDNPDALLICNGYKDLEYIELAFYAKKLGRNPIIVIEKLHELDIILEQSLKLQTDIPLGLRYKPSSKGEGRWEESAGTQAKFGLTCSQLFEAMDLLKSHDRIKDVVLLHYHVGSQIPSIACIKRVVRETARVYVELAKDCPNLHLFDAGGGLGVDYEGVKSNDASSRDYTEGEYARDLISAIMEQCDRAGVEHPTVITESGRALVAHHAVLVVQATESEESVSVIDQLPEPPSDHTLLKDLIDYYQQVNASNIREILHDALEAKNQILELFLNEQITLSERSFAEKSLKYLIAKIRKIARKLARPPRELKQFEDNLFDLYFCNFSVFQSLPDSWAIGQLFPIMPIKMLNQEPTRQGVIADLTCDSDGKINRFIGINEPSQFLRLHELPEDEPYYIGIFLVGAYQEILGDLHNLFGDTNVVHVEISRDGTPTYPIVVEGDSIRSVLEYVRFNVPELLERLRKSCENALECGKLSESDVKQIRSKYRDALESYTYLVKEGE